VEILKSYVWNKQKKFQASECFRTNLLSPEPSVLYDLTLQMNTVLSMRWTRHENCGNQSQCKSWSQTKNDHTYSLALKSFNPNLAWYPSSFTRKILLKNIKMWKQPNDVPPLFFWCIFKIHAAGLQICHFQTLFFSQLITLYQNKLVFFIYLDSKDCNWRFYIFTKQLKQCNLMMNFQPTLIC